MNLKAPLLETAQELFATLTRINPQLEVRKRYDILRSILNIAVEQQLTDVTIKLSGLYAKIDYLIKKHQISQNDRSLSFAINDARVRLSDLTATTDEELQKAWSQDLKAIAQFISLIYDAPIPAQLQGFFSLTYERILPRRIKDSIGKELSYIKCTILRWDDTYIYATREDDATEVCINYIKSSPYLPGDRSYLRRIMVEGEHINLIRPRTDHDGTLLPELIIYAPDYLVNVTSVAGCFDAVGRSPWTELLRRISPYTATQPILLGNFAGQLLDEVAYKKDISYADSIRSFFKQNALAIATCNEMGNEFHQMAQQQKENIRHIMANDFEQQTDQSFQSEEVILEPTFFSDTLGLQGRMDFLDLNYRTIIEQKSGKCKWLPGKGKEEYAGKQEPHYIQMLLYRALLHYDYKQLRADEMQAFLLYSRYHDGLDLATSAPKLLFEAFKLRNILAYSEDWFTRGGLRRLETLTPEQIYPYANGTLWQRYKRPQMEELLAPIHRASSLERSYYFRFMQFVANEHALSRIGNRTKENSGFAATWNTTIEDKREAGNIYEQLSIHPIVNDEGKIEDVHFTFDTTKSTTIDADLSNFREGDIVLFYPYTAYEQPDATATLVFRGTLTDIHTDKVTVRLRNAQTSRNVFDHYHTKVWAIEHDFMESSYNAQYRGLHAFLSAPQSRRDLLLGQRQPSIEPLKARQGDYGNAEFNQLVENALQAEDIYIVIGPPGTGKTSYGMKNILTEELLHANTNVLLLSYTNRAVDEICSKLVEEGIDFIRLGSDYSCEKAYRPYLLSERINQMEHPNKQLVINLIKQTRVFCGTTTALSAALPLFELKQFSLAIIDEASQILEPHLLPLLCATHNDECAIKRFVLIGDEKQLPAVVQQSAEESDVKDPQLNTISLHNCRLSLFERLLDLYGFNEDGSRNEQVCHMLTHQGRMHHDIAYFPSLNFYNDALCEVPLPHQTEATPRANSPHVDWKDMALHHNRIAFISYPLSDDLNEMEPPKVNVIEANIAAQLAQHIYQKCNDFDVLKTLGIIVPYRNQIATVRAAIDRLGIPQLHDITIDTVERYQGSQRDYIIYSFTAKHKYQLLFLTNNEYVDERTHQVIDRKLNVAMTRARKHLVLIGNAPLLSHDYTFNQLINYCKGQQAFIDFQISKKILQ